MALSFKCVQILFQIIHSETNTISGQNETGFSCDGTWNTFRVMFKEPIEIVQNQFYTASATLIVSIFLFEQYIFNYIGLLVRICGYFHCQELKTDLAYK